MALEHTDKMEKTLLYEIPATYKERSLLRRQIERFMDEQAVVPPLSMDDISAYADQIIDIHIVNPGFKGWIMVEVNNCAWRETVASIPHEKRMLLLPRCLSNSKNCEADVDEFGLLCNLCDLCTIPNLQEDADKLGMMSIVAEGFTSVVGLVENGVVDTVIGVSCLDSLERAFPLLINNAVPGLAIPLNKKGCKDTDADYNYVRRMINLRSDKNADLLDYDKLKSSIEDWFSKNKLTKVFSLSNDQTSEISRDWMGGEGKRWRPYLLAATYLALSGEKVAPNNIMLAAIAVECFHKASLVHDDIQDKDSQRYGKPTVHAQHGEHIAINVGDMLLGEGYRILAQCENMELIKIIAEAHVSLCKGQGMELEWSRSPKELTMDYVIDIFCNKTVPAFEVALLMGAVCANADNSVLQILKKYSQAMGIAYQLQDDIEDFETDSPLALRPSAVLAILSEQNEDNDFIISLLTCSDLKKFLNEKQNKPLLNKALNEVKKQTVQYHKAALQALHELKNTELKRLLFRVTRKILG